MIQTRMKNLKRLEGEEKKVYLDNLNAAVLMAEISLLECKPLYRNLGDLIAILHESKDLEISLSDGLPNTINILGINTVKKDIGKELEELKSKIVSGLKKEHEGLDIEQMLAERIKSKIYSFDTVIADEMKAENAHLYEILNTEFTLGGRFYFLKAIEAHPFTLDTVISKQINYYQEVYAGYFELAGFDSKQNKFGGYRFECKFPHKLKKKLFDDERNFKAKHERLLKNNFLNGIDTLYRVIVSDINKRLQISKVSKITVGPYADKHTGELENLPVPENFFEDHPEAFVLNITVEDATPIHKERLYEWEIPEYKLEKRSMVYRFCTEGHTRLKLINFYKEDENVKVFSEGITEDGGHSPFYWWR